MKKFKWVDTWISITLFIVLSICCIVKPSFENIVISYFIIGGWQVTSMLIHELNKWFVSLTGLRRIFHLIALSCLLLIPFGLTKFMLIIVPFMLLCYIFICYRELYTKMKRPLDVLK